MRVIEVRKIELEKIRVPEWAERVFADENELKDLANSIEAHGLIEPIVVRLTSDGHYELISGYRRLQALKMLNAKEVEAKVVECTDEEAVALSIEENEKRAEENPIDTARKVAYMRQKLGLSVSDIAKRLGKSESWVSKLLSIDAMPKEVKEILGKRVNDVEKLYLISTIGDPIKQGMVARLVADFALSKREVEALAKEAKSMDLKEFGRFCDELRLKLREGVEESLIRHGEFRRRNSEGEGEVQGEGAGDAGDFSRLKSSQGQVQPPAQGSQTGQEGRKGPETGECSLCGKVRKWEELSRLRICEDEHQDFHELIRRARQYGSRNIDRVLGIAIPIVDRILIYPSDEWDVIGRNVTELVPYARGLDVEEIKEAIEEVKRRHATS